jgi:HSP90 family molecular chaperone
MKQKIAEELAYEKADPNPEYLIKSIAEQGYSLETALADLLDNSISAKADKIEILTDVADLDNLGLYITDNGDGMTAEELAKSMKFPSSSVERKRDKSDLGRFGLGLKTASFSQTRRFTVLSRKEGGNYSGRTWDVDYLKQVI